MWKGDGAHMGVEMLILDTFTSQEEYRDLATLEWRL